MKQTLTRAAELRALYLLNELLHLDSQTAASFIDGIESQLYDYTEAKQTDIQAIEKKGHADPLIVRANIKRAVVELVWHMQREKDLVWHVQNIFANCVLLDWFNEEIGFVQEEQIEKTGFDDFAAFETDFDESGEITDIYYC